jgi:hypothetical protein
MEQSNRETIACAGAVACESIAQLPAGEIEALATAGEALPWRSWL